MEKAAAPPRRRRAATRASAPLPAAAITPAPETIAADEPLPFDNETLKRIKDIIANARATWFALLGALVFAAITLASVKDVAFFVGTVETKLPIVGFSVPVRSFFWAGALLIAALYAYFHLYLELLWQALGDAPARVPYKPADGGPMRTAPLADYVEPWIVADAALRRRDRLRNIQNDDERAARKRMMPWVGYLVFFGLIWLFGLAVIGWFWWRSMPAHEPLLTGWLALVFAFTLWVYFKSRHSARDYLRNTRTPEKWRKWFPVVFAAIAGLTVVRTSWDPWEIERRDGPFSLLMCENIDRNRVICPENAARVALEAFRPARANLAEVEFTEKPKDWQGKEIMQAEFRLRWCKEHSVLKAEDCGSALDAADPKFRDKKVEEDFRKAWKLRWRIFLASLPNPDLRRKDLRGANLFGARLEGADLSTAKLEGANLYSASLEGANLFNARLEGANLNFARLEGADLSDARLEGADLSLASLEGVNLSRARLEGAGLNRARLGGADLSDARLEGADLSFARFGGADLSRARLEGANLYSASLKGASLFRASLQGANLEGADLSYARLLGERAKPIDLTAIASLSASLWTNSALRDANLEGVDVAELREFEKSFGDGSVKLDAGTARPSRWCAAKLSDAEFFGRWRGWAEAEGAWTIVSSFKNFPAIPPSVPCPSKRRDE